MKVLCVQCLKMNDLGDELSSGDDGKVRFPCPHCGFVTVVTRKKAKASSAPPQPPPQVEAKPAKRPAAPPPKPVPAAADERPTNKQRKNLEAELFDGAEKEVGDWMVRRLDGTEAGPITFDELRSMIQEGDIGKIDEVRRMEERYVPAAFHEETAELFNELDMAGVGSPPSKKKG